jgi:microcystin-dependent protein
VRANGRTIGSATSGATERANADTQVLFEYLWNTVPDSTLPVSTGRGASANADWLANKTITLPDLRGRTIAGLDDMGNSSSGRLTSTGLGNSATVLGGNGGSQTFTLTTTQLPAHTHSTTVSLNGTTSGESNSHTHTVAVSGTTSTDGAHSHTSTAIAANTSTFSAGGVSSGAAGPTTITTTTDGNHSHTFSVTPTSAANNVGHTHTWSGSGAFTSGSTGSGTAFSVVQPTFVMTFYLKL